MDVGKIIRILGYIVYTALWLPIIAVAAIAAPFLVLALDVRAGRPIGGSVDGIRSMLAEAIRHDIDFIRTGTW